MEKEGDCRGSPCQYVWRDPKNELGKLGRRLSEGKCYHTEGIAGAAYLVEKIPKKGRKTGWGGQFMPEISPS